MSRRSTQSPPFQISFSPESQRNRQSSVASSSSSSTSDRESVASSTSSAPPLTPDDLPPPVMAPVDYPYEFRCEMEVVGCGVSFHPSKLDLYISHTVSHFGRHGPPKRTCCPFCDKYFENVNGPMASWRERILHIAHHYRQGAQAELARPDFFVVERLGEKGIITPRDYKFALSQTERPYCDGLVDFGYKTPDKKWKDERNSQEKYDLVGEERSRKRHEASKSKGHKRR